MTEITDEDLNATAAAVGVIARELSAGGCPVELDLPTIATMLTVFGGLAAGGRSLRIWEESAGDVRVEFGDTASGRAIMFSGPSLAVCIAGIMMGPPTDDDLEEVTKPGQDDTSPGPEGAPS